jgi:hypothetical protein
MVVLTILYIIVHTPEIAKHAISYGTTAVLTSALKVQMIRLVEY